MEDRVTAVCDLLMGAAYADHELKEAEQKTVEEHLVALMPDGELSDELKKRIAGFSKDEFDVAKVAGAFADESKEDRLALLKIVASVNSADDECDLDEDDYLKAVAKALKLTEEEISDFTLEYEVEELKESMAKLRPTPPPAPQK